MTPKSLDVSKAIDKAVGAERAVVDSYVRSGRSAGIMGVETVIEREVTVPATPEAEKWSGWGTALKPGYEPICVARKPLAGSVAANVLKYGTGGINIDGCRVGWGQDGDRSEARRSAEYTEAAKAALGGVVAATNGSGFSGDVEAAGDSSAGRWPPNLVFSHAPGCRSARRGWPTGTATANSTGLGGVYVGGDSNRPKGYASGYADGDGRETVPVFNCQDGCPVAELDRQSGQVGAGWKTNYGDRYEERQYDGGSFGGGGYRGNSTYADSGGAGRFFPVFRYQPKAARSERDMGMPTGAPKRELNWSSGDRNPGSFQSENTDRTARNDHPTIKPVELMRWLIRLVTPPGGLVLDPFVGSGSTGMAAAFEHTRFVGIERNADYAERIAAPRIAHALMLAADAGRQPSLFD